MASRKPVDRRLRSKRITEQPKPTGREPIQGTTRAKRDRARAKHRTELAAAPGNPGRLRRSERTPTQPAGAKPYDDSKDQYKGGKRALKKGEFPGEAIGGPKGSIAKKGKGGRKYPVINNDPKLAAKKKADAVRKRMGKKKNWGMGKDELSRTRSGERDYTGHKRDKSKTDKGREDYTWRKKK